MNDDKRFLRQLKKQVKKQGNRKRRRFLKDPYAHPDDFDFGGDCSESMNEPRSKRDKPAEPDDD